MSTLSYDPAFACDPTPHIVVAKYSSVHFEARLAGDVTDNDKVGYGTDLEMALAILCDLDPRAKGLTYEVRHDPDE